VTAPGTLFGRPRAVRGRVRRAADASVRAYRAGGLLEHVDADLVAIHRVLADTVDLAERTHASPYVVTMAARGFLDACAALKARCGVIAPDDDDAIWRELSAPLEHPPTT